MRALFAAGHTVAEVAREVGVDYAFAYDVAKRAGFADTAARRRGVSRGSATRSENVAAPSTKSASWPAVDFDTSTTIVIERMDGGPRLVIEDAELILWEMIRQDAGARAFDARAGQGDPNLIQAEDIRAINQMRARSSPVAWEPVTGPASWLAALDPQQALFEIDDAEWSDRWAYLIEAALTAAAGPKRGIARVTKILHLKRPRLVPVLDSLVVQQMGGRNRSAIEMVDHLRKVGAKNRNGLGTIADALEKLDVHRTQVRILDVLLWASHPASSLVPSLGRWERHLRRGGDRARESPS